MMFVNGNYISRCAAEYSKAARSDFLLYALIAIYALAGIAYVESVTEIEPAIFTNYARIWSKNFLITFPVALFLIGLVHIIHRVDKRRMLAFRKMFAPLRLARFLAGTQLLMAMMIFQATFTLIKISLSHDGFLFDQVQSDIDRTLHFGVDPWKILYWISDSQMLLTLLELNYNMIWLIVSFSVLYWFAVSPKAESSRVRFFVCFMLVWLIIGNILAGVYISAGPAYYAFVTGDEERYSQQLMLLARNSGQHGAVVGLHEYLWTHHSAGGAGIGTGISAFPSVHVGLIAMCALFVNEFSRRLGLIFFAYTGLILLSSVYLAWHYAIDGYVSIIIVIAIYTAAKYLPNLLSRSIKLRINYHSATNSRVTGRL